MFGQMSSILANAFGKNPLYRVFSIKLRLWRGDPFLKNEKNKLIRSQYKNCVCIGVRMRVKNFEVQLEVRFGLNKF